MVEPALAVRPEADPERLLIVPVLEGADGAPRRFVLVRWPDWPHPAMLSSATPSSVDSIEAVVRDLLSARLSLRLAGAPRASETRLPARMPRARRFEPGTGWLRAVAAPVEGDPTPDALLAGVEVVTLEEGLALLPTTLERRVLQLAAELAEG